jgi:ABC-type branched-subunit amino acid transport system ATPase component
MADDTILETRSLTKEFKGFVAISKHPDVIQAYLGMAHA